ncbi:hypothetical protein [Neisseria sp. Ec49-e6-T10]|uniref:hypothetical protein n=1 Tax=Neisseria sp. Ec49-e6-T10 TaxID=3140744 RepID=UPI003EB7E54A
MLKKILILCFISLLSCNQLVISQRLYSPRNAPPVWIEIDTSQIEELIAQCFSIMGYKHRIIRDHEPSNSHPLKDHVVICSRYSISPEYRKSLDDRFTNSYFLKQNIQISKKQEKQLNEVYKKLYLVIWKVNLIDALYPPMPDDFKKEFNQQTGFTDYINRLGQKNYNKLTTDELINNFFGSQEKFNQAENKFYTSKYKKYKLGK